VGPSRLITQCGSSLTQIEGEEGVANDVPEEETPVSIDTDHARLGAATSDYTGDQAISVDEGYSRASAEVFRAGENGNREETDSTSVLVYSSSRHRGAGPSSVSEIKPGGHPALANKRFGRSVFVNLGAISAAVGNQGVHQNAFFVSR